MQNSLLPLSSSPVEGEKENSFHGRRKEAGKKQQEGRRKTAMSVSPYVSYACGRGQALPVCGGGTMLIMSSMLSLRKPDCVEELIPSWA